MKITRRRVVIGGIGLVVLAALASGPSEKTAVPPPTTAAPGITILPPPTPTSSPTITPSKTPTPSPTSKPATATRQASTAILPAESTAAPAPTAEPVQPPPAPVAGGYVCPDGAACIKGNINNGEKIYHFPGCASYDRTEIDVSKGERWFVTSAEAEAAGWRRAQNCP